MLEHVTLAISDRWRLRGLMCRDLQMRLVGSSIVRFFDAIVLSNGWDDTTAVLQLLSHLEGDALNVALLVPESRRATRVGLVGALTSHYESLGRLADYRRQFERTTRTAGEDPSIFAITLETLPVKAFGDMGQTAQLHIIRDRFIAGHNNRELRRHLDSVSPETRHPIYCVSLPGVGESRQFRHFDIQEAGTRQAFADLHGRCVKWWNGCPGCGCSYRHTVSAR